VVDCPGLDWRAATLLALFWVQELLRMLFGTGIGAGPFECFAAEAEIGLPLQMTLWHAGVLEWLGIEVGN